MQEEQEKSSGETNQQEGQSWKDWFKDWLPDEKWNPFLVTLLLGVAVAVIPAI